MYLHGREEGPVPSCFTGNLFTRHPLQVQNTLGAEDREIIFQLRNKIYIWYLFFSDLVLRAWGLRGRSPGFCPLTLSGSVVQWRGWEGREQGKMVEGRLGGWERLSNILYLPPIAAEPYPALSVIPTLRTPNGELGFSMVWLLNPLLKLYVVQEYAVPGIGLHRVTRSGSTSIVTAAVSAVLATITA